MLQARPAPAGPSHAPRRRWWADVRPEVLAGVTATLALALIGAGLVVHVLAGPVAVQLVLAAAATAVRPAAAALHGRHRKGRTGPARSGYTARG